MSLGPVTFLFLIPALAAVVIALMPGSKLSAYVNAGASFLTFLAALSLLSAERPAPGAYVVVDEFNTIFVVLITFVAFTTSVFSATYVEYELETGRVTPAFRLRLSAARLWHQDRSLSPACLAARRPCRGSNADHRGALRATAQRRALRAAPLQDAARRQSGGAGARAADDRHGACFTFIRRVHALPPARH
jgi:hypothetical protein